MKIFIVYICLIFIRQDFESFVNYSDKSNSICSFIFYSDTDFLFKKGEKTIANGRT